jgi:hypothetical protein
MRMVRLVSFDLPVLIIAVCVIRLTWLLFVKTEINIYTAYRSAYHLPLLNYKYFRIPYLYGKSKNNFNNFT